MMIASLRSALYGSIGKKVPVHNCRPMISTGLSLLDRALGGGIRTGSVVSVLGGPGSGRSTFCLSLLGEMGMRDRDCGLYLHETEGQFTNLSSYLGDVISDRVRRVDAYFGGSGQSVWRYISRLDGKYLYVLDSLDGLLEDSPTQLNNMEANIGFDGVRTNGSVLVISSQEKIINGKPVFAGGFAVRFYADYCFSLDYVGELYRTVGGKRRQVGTQTTIKIVKCPGHLGALKEVSAPILVNYGYNDEGSLFDYLRENGSICVGKRRGWFEYPKYGVYGSRDVVEACITEHKTDILNGLDVA